VRGLADVWLLPLGSRSFNAEGCTSVDVSIKNISRLNTTSVIPTELKFTLILFLEVIAIYFSDFTGSFNISINSVRVASRLKTTFSTLTTRVL